MNAKFTTCSPIMSEENRNFLKNSYFVNVRKTVSGSARAVLGYDPSHCVSAILVFTAYHYQRGTRLLSTFCLVCAQYAARVGNSKKKFHI